MSKRKNNDEDNVTQTHRHQEPEGFQAALRIWRSFAHYRGLVVASPTRLIGAERTIYGDSDDVSFGPKDYKLINKDLLFGGDLWLSKKEKEVLSSIADILLEMSEVDIKDCRAPDSATVPPHEDERARWDVRVSDSHRVGTVVRVGEGSKKHYLLYLWNGGWYRVQGQPCFDLPVFGLADLRKRPEAPVMIHEGPKARMGAATVGNPRLSGGVGKLSNWMQLYTHIGWHGSDIGLEWTDWTPLRGRRVLIWPDIDEAGIFLARKVARRISRMGGIVEYVNWSADEFERYASWDWGDTPNELILEMTRSDLRARTLKVESAIDASGRLLEEWTRRSVYDPERGELYVAERDYRPLPLSNFVIGLPKNTREKIVTSEITRFCGVDYRPGLKPGLMKNGLINTARVSIREPMIAAPLAREVYKEISGRWLSKMVPNPQQRKHLIRRAAWALARPHKIPFHMVVMKGESGIGKSVFIDTLLRVAGSDRAVALFPDSIMGQFNFQVAHKSIVGVHEIHSNEVSRKQNAARLKELLANETITVEEKNRPKVNMSNVIHWFAATNEKVPFVMEHGNDRFYFVDCASPQTPLARKKKDKFFWEWAPKFKEEAFLDELYAAAKWTCDIMTKNVAMTMVGRATKQKTWAVMETSSLRAWEQYLLGRLRDLRDMADDRKIPLVFFGSDVVRLVRREYKFVGEFDIRSRMNDFGYYTLKDNRGEKVKRRVGNGIREQMWVHADQANAITAAGRYGELEVVGLDGGITGE